MGDWLKSKKMKDPVRGTLHVSACTPAPHTATSANFALNGIVSAGGIMPTAVEHEGVAKTRKWPRPGQILPITVDRADPTRIRIEWDEVPDSWDTARQQAEQQAESMRQTGPGQAGAGQAEAGQGTWSNVVFQQGTSTTLDASSVPGLREEIMQLVTSHGSDPARVQQLINAKLVERGVLNPDGSPGPAATVTSSGPAPAAPAAAYVAGAAEDPADRLRKLQQLHRDGLVTDEEFAQLRRQILTDL